MNRFIFLTVAGLLTGIAVPSWSADTVQTKPPAGTQPQFTVPTSSQVTGKSHLQKRRDAQQRLKKAIEERSARKIAPGADVATPAAVKGGAK